ncbi:histidine phosphatase family protein, partial [Chloroflexota bacterium]
MKLLLVRHGQTDYNRWKRYQGRTDTVLNQMGLRQAIELQQRLLPEEINKVYASSLMRAMDTAYIIAGGRGIEVVSSENLVEIDFGKLEGMTYDEIVTEYPDWQPTNFDFIPCGGESLEHLARRVKAFCGELRSGQLADSTVLVVSHAGCLRILLCDLFRIGLDKWWQIPIELASLTVIENV